MVCSCCKQAGHNVRTCPKLEVGAEKAAEAIASGAAEAIVVGIITAACPPAGMAVGGVLLARKVYNAGKHTYGATSAKTQAERRHHAKMMILDSVADGLD
jgi:hypothetical protein